MDEFELFSVFVKEDSKIRIELNDELEDWTDEPTSLMDKADTDAIYTVVANIMERLKALPHRTKED